MQTLELPPVANTVKQFNIWQNSPARYFDDVFKGSKCYKRQIEIAESVRDNERTYVPSCNGVGKTFDAARIALWFSNCYVPSIVVTTAPTAVQVEKLLWGEIHSHTSGTDAFSRVTMSKTRMDWGPDHYIIGRAAKVDTAEHDQGVRFQGFHSPHILFILDEAPGIAAKIYEAIEGSMTGAHCRILAIGNPTGASGPFFEACRAGEGKVISLNVFDSPNFIENKIICIEDLEKMREWTSEQFKALKNPYPELSNPKWAVGRMKKWGKDSPMFKARVLGRFPERGDDELIALSWCQDCIAPNWEKRRTTKKVLAIDVARFGSDYTCFFGMEHWKQIYKDKYNGHDTMYTANKAIKLIKEQGYEVVVIDADGVGGGVADKIRESVNKMGLRVNLLDYHGGHKPKDDDFFLNNRSENWWALRELIRTAKIQIEDEGDMFHQLTSIKYSQDSKGRTQLEQKKDMKRRGLESPDEADALVMAIYGSEIRTTGEIIEDIDEGEMIESSKAPWEDN